MVLARIVDRLRSIWAWGRRDWRYDGEDTGPVDLGVELTPEVPLPSLMDHITEMSTSTHGELKAARRAARGDPPHKIRMSYPEPGSVPVQVYPDWLNDDH
jgi:hypothetical protein